MKIFDDIFRSKYLTLCFRAPHVFLLCYTLSALIGLWSRLHRAWLNHTRILRLFMYSFQKSCWLLLCCIFHSPSFSVFPNTQHKRWSMYFLTIWRGFLLICVLHFGGGAHSHCFYTQSTGWHLLPTSEHLSSGHIHESHGSQCLKINSFPLSPLDVICIHPNLQGFFQLEPLKEGV